MNTWLPLYSLAFWLLVACVLAVNISFPDVLIGRYPAGRLGIGVFMLFVGLRGVFIAVRMLREY